MNYNILRDTELSRIYIVYLENGMRKKYNVKLRFMDTKECYFSTSLPDKFRKPKNKIPVEIFAYTTDGIYHTTLKLLDSSVSLTETLFTVEIPKNWDFKQLRQSSRKQQALPFVIKFDDGYEITGTTHDLSLGGFSYIAERNISSIYERLKCKISIEFPNDLIINFNGRKLVTEGQFVRKQEFMGEYAPEGSLYAFRFLGLSGEQNEVLRVFLLKLD